MGQCNTPEVGGIRSIIRNRAGNYIEEALYGGLTVAEFPKNRSLECVQ
jgi:hypothetical protein